MTDELDVRTRFAEEFHFERENAEPERKSPPHEVCAPRPPSPKLRTDVINVAAAKRFQLSGKTQMKTWEIRKNHQRGLPTSGSLHQIAHRATQLRKMLDDFRDSEDCDFRIVRDNVHAGAAHLRPAHSENFHFSTFFQLGRKARCIHIAAGFARGKQNLRW